MIDPHAFPTAENAYQACRSAKSGNSAQGTTGAGTGATVGKWAGLEFAMKGGVGVAAVEFDGVEIEALLAVNSVGDIVESNGAILAGAQRNGKFLACSGYPDCQNTMDFKRDENGKIIYQ